MSTLAGSSEFPLGPQAWPLLYAQEPEEETDYDELPETQENRPTHGSTVRRSAPPKQKKPSGMRPLILLLLLILIAGAAYVVMTPGAIPPYLAEMIGLGSPETPTVPSIGPSAKVPSAPGPGPSPAPISPAPPTATTSAPPQEPGVPSGPAPATPAPAAPGPTTAAAPPNAVPAPAFGEGQMVFVALDPTLPVGMMVLSGDSVGSKPGPSVRPGAQVIVLDAEYMPNGWIYSVRTPDGSIGWISEKRLKLGR